MQLCVPGGHCEPPSRGTWAKGCGLPAEAGACSPPCAQGKNGESPIDPTIKIGSSLQSCIPSLGLTAPLFYSKKLSLPTAQCGSGPLPHRSCPPTHG